MKPYVYLVLILTTIALCGFLGNIVDKDTVKGRVDIFYNNYTQEQIKNFKTDFNLNNIERLFLYYQKHNTSNDSQERDYWMELCTIMRNGISEREQIGYDTCKTYPGVLVNNEYSVFRKAFLFTGAQEPLAKKQLSATPSLPNGATIQLMQGDNTVIKKALLEAKNKQEACVFQLVALENQPNEYKNEFLTNFDDGCYKELDTYSANFSKYKIQFIDLVKNLK